MVILLLLTSLLLGTGGSYFIYRFGQNFGLIDTPNYRSSHSTPTPKGGGIGILATFLLVSIVTKQPVSFWVPVTLISVLGLYDDKVEISARFRLILQLACTTFALLGLYSNPTTTLISYALLPLWIMYIAGTANFYNFMDGINGIAGLTGIVCFGLMSIYLLGDGFSPALSLLSACISFSCIGFLPFNIIRAKIFMGDSGSILLGFVFAILVYHASTTVLNFLCYASLLFPFYIDELSTMMVRLKNKENLAKPHRKHIYQLLANELGYRHWQVSGAYALLQLVVAWSVFSIRSQGIIAVLLFLFISSLCFVLFSRHIRFKAAAIVAE